MADSNTLSSLSCQPHTVLTAKAILFASLKCNTPLRKNLSSSSHLHTLRSPSYDSRVACDESFVENHGVKSAISDSPFAGSTLSLEDNENTSRACNSNIAIEGDSTMQVLIQAFCE